VLSHVTNLGHLTDYGLAFFADAVALTDGDVTLTYAALDERANRVANGLAHLGVEHGERVALLFPNEFRYVEALLGAMRAGAVAVPVNVRLGWDSLRHVVADSGARVLVASHAFADSARRLADDCPAIAHTVVANARDGDGLDYDTWLEDADASRRTGHDVAPDDLCMQPYTSGSTGRPKGVLLHHAGQVHNAEMMRRVLMVTSGDRALVSVPLFHANAMSGALLPFLMSGASVVILPGFDAADVVAAIARERCTYMTGVPATYTLLLAHLRQGVTHDVSSMRFLACGSAPVSEQLLRELNEAFGGVEVIEAYGLTEGGPVVSSNPRWGVRKLGSTGLPLPDVTVQIVDDDGAPLGPGQVGELWVKSPGAARGYHNLPAVTAEKRTTDGWLRTGDVMRMDTDGYLYFKGRRDDMINSGGENVYPKEVEDILRAHPAVAEVCVVPVPHQVKGAVPVAFVVCSDPAPTEAELKEFFLARGPAYAHPRRVFALGSLPLSGTGKVDRAGLTRQAGELVSRGTHGGTS
jgi:long-chain acyl-CoA synthetase